MSCLEIDQPFVLAFRFVMTPGTTTPPCIHTGLCVFNLVSHFHCLGLDPQNGPLFISHLSSSLWAIHIANPFITVQESANGD